MTARVKPNTEAENGKTMRFAMDTGKMHLFDPETEIAICH